MAVGKHLFWQRQTVNSKRESDYFISTFILQENLSALHSPQTLWGFLIRMGIARVWRAE